MNTANLQLSKTSNHGVFHLCECGINQSSESNVNPDQINFFYVCQDYSRGSIYITDLFFM